MQLKSRQDISASCDDVFATLTDFPAFERRILNRGVALRRVDEPRAEHAGAEWETRFQLRGRERELRLVLTDCEAPSQLIFSGVSQGFNIESMIELIPLSRQSTRIVVIFKANARNLAGRMMLQSLKLARRQTQRRFDDAVTRFAQDIAAQS